MKNQTREKASFIRLLILSGTRALSSGCGIDFRTKILFRLSRVTKPFISQLYE